MSRLLIVLSLCDLQLHQGGSKFERAIHTDLSTDRLTTEDFQRLRTATVLLFLTDSDTAASSSSGGGSSSGSSSGWSLVFPWARGGNWRGMVDQGQFAQVLQQGQMVSGIWQSRLD